MKPLKIELSAFGPFAATQRVDFGELAGNRLFLITGPTGSGKTTLLDGICFALYGDTSGAERDGRQMRSDNAGPEALTEVVFDFALGERRYRVRRVPEQERAKRRGEGTTTQKADAALWDRSDAEGDAEGRVLETGWTAVTRRVEALVGFSSEQFRQVIVLPQGRFRELLTAGSEQREAILQRLFRTEFYLAVQRALKERAAELRRRSEALGERRRTLLEQAEAPDEKGLADRLAGLDEQVKALDALLESLRSEEVAAETALHRGRTLAGLFEALSAARQRADALQALESEFDERRRELESAERAASLDDLHGQLTEARSHLESQSQRHREAEAAAAGAAAAMPAVERALAEAEGEEPQRNKLRRAIADFERYRGEVQGIVSARDAVTGLRRELAAAEAERQGLAQQLEETRAAQAAAAVRLDEARQASARLDGLRQGLESAKSRLERHGRLAATESETRRLERGSREAASALAGAEAGLATTRTELQALQKAFTEGQAGILAAGLAEGEPCPVCGSSHHPRPAPLGTEVPDRDLLEAAGSRLEAAEQAREQCRGVLLEVEKALALARQQRDALVQDLGPDVSQATGVLEAAAAQAARAFEVASATAGSLETAEADAVGLAARQAGEEKVLVEAGEALTGLQNRLAAAAASLAEREATVPEAWRAPGAAEAALAKAQKSLEQSERRLAGARAGLVTAREARSSAEAAVKAAAEALDASRRALEAVSATWSHRCVAAGFAREGDYAAARRGAGAREALRSAIRAHDEARVSAFERLKLAMEAVEGKEPPDLAALESSEARKREARAQAEEGRATLAAALATGRGTEKALAKTGKALEQVREAFAVIGRLSDVANGQNPYRLSFQRFVLTALLDDVLVAASRRLLRMSKGRYRLERVTAQGAQRGQGGLDLQVEDGYTGKVRPVASLSGGESFLAALSLALGLAEVVEAYAGGVRLDTIFIDEGFGSLDPEALDLAVNTLVDLQSQGRLVGVISHVPELKERIDVRLEMTSNRGSSTAAFCLP